jgi:nitroreductase
MYFSSGSNHYKQGGKQPLDIIKVMGKRRSARAFKSEPISRETIEEILKLAINAPSSNNLQPWEITIVMDKEKDRLSRTILQAYHEKRFSCRSGAVKQLPQAIRQRGVQTRDEMSIYTDKLNVPIDDFVNEGSCNFYGAPVAIIICLDDSFSTRQLVDVGTLTGYIVLAAHAYSLATCPIGLITDYADEIKDLLNIPESKKVVIGVAIGYPDNKNPINSFKSFRADLKELVRWI